MRNADGFCGEGICRRCWLLLAGTARWSLRQGREWKCVLVFAAIAVSTELLPSSTVWAACTPSASAGLPAPGTVVDCTGLTNNQNIIDGYGTGTQDGLTINVQSGAQVQGGRGLFLGSNNNIVNEGQIVGSPGAGVVAASATISNSGTITSLSGTAIVFPILNITNFASGNIVGQGDGIQIGDGTQIGSAIINNLGNISGFRGIFATTGVNIVVTNYGTISGIRAAGVSSTIVNFGTITGINGPAIEYLGTNILTLAPGSVINGNVLAGASDRLQLGGSGVDVFNASLIGSQYQNFGGFDKIGNSTWTLTGVGATGMSWTVQQGTLIVTGTLTNASFVVLNSGATLGGTGTVGNTTIAAGGTLAPGSGTPATAMTVQGNLAFQSGAFYLVQVNPAAASTTNVNGTATLAGTVNALFAPGSYLTRNYTILSATGGIGGTQFGGLTTTNLPAGVQASVSYTANDVLLNLVAQIGTGGGLNQNQQNVASAMNNFFNSGGTLPPGFVTALTDPALGNALTQLSGEVASGMPRASFLSSSLFLNLMLDPFMVGRTGGFGASATSYAAQPRHPAEEAFAAALPVKAPPLISAFEQRWTVWGSAFGGRNRTDGDLTVGSNDLRATAAGFAMGADYRVSPDTVLGLATAIGETRWRVAGLGEGNADVAQFGGYASTRWESFYLSGAIAGAWYRASTDRTLNIAGSDRLEADFDAGSIGGRIEAGRRWQYANVGVTPYGGLQVQSAHRPAYSEAATAGSNQFALSYTKVTATDTRSELGAWLDTQHLLATGATLLLRGRVAWAHDFNPDSRINAVFQTLPGTSFTVDGAAFPRDAALTSAVAELRFASGATLIGKLDGEFSGRSHTLAATGTLRYAW